MVSGAATCSSYNQKALFYSCQHLLSDGVDAEQYKMQPYLKKLSAQKRVVEYFY